MITIVIITGGIHRYSPKSNNSDKRFVNEVNYIDEWTTGNGEKYLHYHCVCPRFNYDYVSYVYDEQLL